MLFSTIKTVLSISAHADDSEIGAGGTLNKLIDQGVKVYHLILSIAEESVPDEFRKDILKDEAIEAGKVLGIAPSNIFIYRFPVRKLNYHRQEILEIILKHKKSIKPDLVFCPSSFDIHQDHSCVRDEVVRAFKDTSILGYELTWNDFKTNYNFFVSLTEEELQKKTTALKAYKSQTQKNYFSEEIIKVIAISRAAKIKKQYVELFDVIRLIN